MEDELLLALDSLPGLYGMAQQVQPRIVRRKVSRKPMPPCITGRSRADVYTRSRVIS